MQIGDKKTRDKRKEKRLVLRDQEGEQDSQIETLSNSGKSFFDKNINQTRTSDKRKDARPLKHEPKLT